MAGWTCPDKDVIDWDGTISVRNNLIVNKNVGIGTTNLGARLSIKTSSIVNDIYQYIGGALPSIGAWFIINAGDPVSRISIDGYSPTGSNNIHLDPVYNNYIRAGNVGIGLTNPQEKLDIGVSGAIALRISALEHDYNTRALIGDSATNGGYLAIHGNDDLIKILLRGYPISNTQAYFTAGNIGLGTSATDNRCSVSGAISMSNIIVPTALTVNSGAIFVSGGALYYFGSTGTVTKIANA